MTWLVLIVVAVAVAGGATWYLLTQPVGGRPGAATGGDLVDPRWLEQRVRDLVAIPSRSFGSPEHLDVAAAYVRAEMERSGGTVREQPFTVEGQTYRNVCAAFGPETRDLIVVGAHYDVVDGSPGADDNASGVAGLLALAHLLSRETLRHRVELVAYSLEEPPAYATAAMGSASHARALQAQGANVLGMLSLEMIGYFRDEPGSQQFPLPGLAMWYPDRGDFIAVVSRLRESRLVRVVKRAMRAATPLPVHSFNGPPFIQEVAFSDHRSYWSCGYPAAMITDTSLYRNPHYHLETDLPMTLDYNRMAQVVIGVRAAVLSLDEP